MHRIKIQRHENKKVIKTTVVDDEEGKPQTIEYETTEWKVEDTWQDTLPANRGALETLTSIVSNFVGFSKEKNTLDNNIRFTVEILESTHDEFDDQTIKLFFLCHECNRISFDVNCGEQKGIAMVYSCQGCGKELAVIQP